MSSVRLSIVLLAVLLAGCGSGHSAKKPTKAQFVTQANAICKRVNTRLTSDAAKVFKGPTPTQATITGYLHRTAEPQLKAELDDIANLGAPKGDEATVKAILDAVRAGLKRVEADPVLLSASGSKSPFADANAKAKAYGLTVCGS